MIISGLQKVTLLDYPQHIACTIFLGHCNLRCPFCHNMTLVTNPENYGIIHINEILDYLKERVGKLNGVAITGGEPLLNDDIEELLIPIKNLGYKIKLDTNGFFPEKIEKLIDDNLVDYFAMDIKAGFSNYKTAINKDFTSSDKNNVLKSIDLLMKKAIDYEFRTTCVKGIHTENDFVEIGHMINGAKNYFLQNYKEAPGMDNLPYKSFSREELINFVKIVSENIEKIEIRGV